MPDNKAIRIDQEVIDTFDNETEYLFALTERQAALLLGQTDYISWAKRWINLTYTVDDIEQLKDDIDYRLMTPLEGAMLTKEEVCEAVTCALAKAGTALAAGINSNISVEVDDDGNIIVDTGDDLQDEQIAFDDSFGDCVYVYDRVLEYIQDYEDYFSDNPASEATTVEWLSYKYLVNAEIATAVADYYAHRDLMNPQPMPPGTELQLEYFCEGLLKQVTAAFIIDSPLGDKNLLLQMMDALTQEQYVQWATQNTTPRTGYQSAPCYTLPTQFFTYSAANFAAKANIIPYLSTPQTDRVKVYQVSGKITGADGREFDGFYLKDENGMITPKNPNFQRQGFGGSVVIGAPAYNPAGGYYAFFDMDGTNTYVSQLLVTQGLSVGEVDDFAPASGELTINLIDIGAQ